MKELRDELRGACLWLAVTTLVTVGVWVSVYTDKDGFVFRVLSPGWVGALAIALVPLAASVAIAMVLALTEDK